MAMTLSRTAGAARAPSVVTVSISLCSCVGVSGRAPVSVPCCTAWIVDSVPPVEGVDLRPETVAIGVQCMSLASVCEK